MRIVLNGCEKLYTNYNVSSISNNKARPKYISVACAKETIMTKSQPAKPKVIWKSCGNKDTFGAGIANHKRLKHKITKLLSYLRLIMYQY